MSQRMRRPGPAEAVIRQALAVELAADDEFSVGQTRMAVMY